MQSINLKDISKSFDGKKILSDINLTVDPSEFFVLVGPSGCGKSTLLRLIAGLDSSDSGEIYLQDKDVTNLPPQERKISMVFQSYALFPHLSVKNNILFGLDNQGISKEEQLERLNQAVELTDLGELLDRKPKQLSGGQRQRVALARAIASRRAICLMDEPLSNLDAELREKMRTQIRELQTNLGMTIVYVTHDQTEAMTMGDRIAVLNNGSVQQMGAPLDLYNHPKNKFVAGFLGTPKMNFFIPTSYEAGEFGGEKMTFLTNGNKDIAIPLTEAQLETLKNHNDLIIGIRPEHLRLSSTDDSTIKGKVVTVEQLGNETIVIFEIDKEQYIAKLKGQLDFKAGQDIYFVVKGDIHFFDGKTEKIIELKGEK